MMVSIQSCVASSISNRMLSFGMAGLMRCLTVCCSLARPGGIH